MLAWVRVQDDPHGGACREDALCVPETARHNPAKGKRHLIRNHDRLKPFTLQVRAATSRRHRPRWEAPPTVPSHLRQVLLGCRWRRCERTVIIDVGR